MSKLKAKVKLTDFQQLFEHHFLYQHVDASNHLRAPNIGLSMLSKLTTLSGEILLEVITLQEESLPFHDTVFKSYACDRMRKRTDIESKLLHIDDLGIIRFE